MSHHMASSLPNVAVDVRGILGEAGAGIYYYILHLLDALGELELPLEPVLWFAMRSNPLEVPGALPDLRRLAERYPVRHKRLSNQLLYTTGAMRLWCSWPGWLPLPELLERDLALFHATHWPLPVSRRVPTVLTIHDLAGCEHPEWFAPGHLELVRTMARRARHVAHVIADSHATREDVLRFTGAAPERVSVVHLAADQTFSQPRDPQVTAAVLERHGLRRPYLLSLGTVEPRKNLARLLAAYELLREREAGAPTLAVVGAAGWERAEALQSLGRLAERKEAVVTGHVPRADLPHLVGAAELLVYVSLKEGFGLPPLEAMAAGTPVVTSNCSSLPEVVGDAALLVDPRSVEEIAEGMRRLLADPALAAALVERGKARAATFSWSRAARQTAEVYLKVLAERGQSPSG